ncbi:MAG TPA: M48 family metallopeptidase [Opitutaceae bacterium]|nr:M48 family metallopeptidase [Opitutaceae bacterium]
MSSAITPTAPQSPSVETVRTWFQGRLPSSQTSFRYRAGLMATAGAMVLLPLLYLAIVVAVTGVGALWALYGLVIFEHIHSFYSLVAYAGPLLAVFFCVCFLIRPLFTSAPPKPPAVQINLTKEPALAEFIRSITGAVGAPMPAVVEVDCTANAAASFRDGGAGVGRRKLTLTLGLPLIGTLEIGEFAALLAHEFGHFSQKAGMTSLFLIRSVNHWLARVVHERDAWDRELEEGVQRGHWVGIAIAALTQMVVFVSRKILACLLNAGHAISCFQMRQMEYDADRTATSLAGTASHLALAKKTAPLSEAHAAAFAGLQDLWSDRVLPQDFPAFVLDRQSSRSIQPPSARPPQKRSHWSDTHPSREERDARIVADAAEGFFRASGAAVSLFRDFTKLSRAATEHLYRVELGLDLRTVDLLETSEIAYRVDSERNAFAEWESFAGHLLSLQRPFPLANALQQALEGTLIPADRHLFHRRQLESRTEAARLNGEWIKHQNSCSKALLAERLLSSGIRLACGGLGLAKGTREEALAHLAEAREATAAVEQALLPLSENLRNYLVATVAQAQAESGHPRSAPITQAARALVAFESLAMQVPDLLARWDLAQLLAANATSLRGHPLSIDAQRSLIAAFNGTLAEAKKIKDPFRKAPPKGWTFADHLRNLLPQDAAAIEVRAQALLSGIANVHQRLVSTIHYHGLDLPPRIPPSVG